MQACDRGYPPLVGEKYEGVVHLEAIVEIGDKRAETMLRFRHPWVFSKGLVTKPKLVPGSMVQVRAKKGHIGWAFYHPHNAIALRMVSFDAQPPEPSFWKTQLERCYQMRQSLLGSNTCFRLVHGENDGFPGLTIDVFGPLVCLQNVCAGMEPLKEYLANKLLDFPGVKGVFEFLSNEGWGFFYINN